MQRQPVFPIFGDGLCRGHDVEGASEEAPFRPHARRPVVIDGLPDDLRPLTDRRFSDPHWIFERKLDGVRGLAFRDGARVRLLSRNGQKLNGTYPELVEALVKQDRCRFVVDGEIVAFEGRRTRFSRLQGRPGITDPEEARASRIPVSTTSFVYSRSMTGGPLWPGWPSASWVSRVTGLCAAGRAEHQGSGGSDD